MEESILVTIRTLLGYATDEETTPFDADIISNINSVLNSLTQMGVGPDEGFEITGVTETWSDFLGENAIKFNMVKTYIANRVKLAWDSGTMSSTMAEALRNDIAQTEWRIGIIVDNLG